MRPDTSLRISVHRLASGVLWALLVVALLCAGPTARPVRAAPLTPPFGVAVVPFADRRHPDGPAWLGHFLSERIAKALLRARQVAVLPLETAALWQRTLGLRTDAPLTDAQLGRMGVQVVVQGTTQEVLALAELQLHVRTADGELLPGERGTLRFALADEPPGQVLGRVLGRVEAALLPDAHLAEPHPPPDWKGVETLYTLLATPVVPGDRGVRPGLIARLKPLVDTPGLGGRAHEALASLLMEQALLYLPQGAGQQLMLGEALQHATAAAAGDPTDTHRQALQAELHFFLKRDYEAKTEASIARIHNPLEPLAFVVLGLVAGLSTGEANETLGRALQIDPFLRTAARPAGSAPFQGGLLEDSFRTWEDLRARGGLATHEDYAQLLANAIAHFDRKEWDDAERLFRQAAQREDNDYTPWLYLNRILLELGHPAEAVPGLRRLAQDNPQEADILYFLGVALEDSGEPAAAADAYRKALIERPHDTRSQYRLATAEIAQRHWAEALRALRDVLHEEPENAEAWLKLGTVHMEQQDWPAARDALQRAVELEPGLQEARTRLEQVQKRG